MEMVNVTAHEEVPAPTAAAAAARSAAAQREARPNL
jgi:hypothetical protein